MLKGMSKKALLKGCHMGLCNNPKHWSKEIYLQHQYGDSTLPHVYMVTELKLKKRKKTVANEATGCSIKNAKWT